MILSYAVPELWPGIQIPSCEPTGGDNVHVIVDQPSSVIKLVSLNFHERIYLSLFSLNVRLISWTSAVL